MVTYTGVFVRHFKKSPSANYDGTFFVRGILLCPSGEIQVHAKNALFAPTEGQSYQMSGTLSRSYYKGRTSTVLEFSDIRQVWSVHDLIQYLSGPDFTGVGAVTAKKLVQTYKEQVLDVIDFEPDRLLADGFSDKVKKALIAGRGKDGASNILRKFFPGIKPSQVNRIIEVYGDTDTLSRFRLDPYKILFQAKKEGWRNFAFHDVDEMALKLGVQPDSDARLSAVLSFRASDILFSNGDVCFPDVDEGIFLLAQACASEMGVIYDDGFLGRVRQFVFSGEGGLLVSDPGTGAALYPKELLEAEEMISDVLCSMKQKDSLCGASLPEMLSAISEREQSYGRMLSDEQKLAVVSILRNRVSALTGVPGCGKTTTASFVITLWNEFCPEKKVWLFAPTGAACRRMRESVETSGFGISRWDHSVHTVASLLYGSRSCLSEKDFDGCLVILDETGMVGYEDMAGFLEKVRFSQLLFLGDADQLPSISPGSFLSDLCSGGMVARYHLSVSRRAMKGSLSIPQNAALLNDGKDPSLWDWSNPDVFSAIQLPDEAAEDLLCEKYVSFYHDWENAVSRRKDFLFNVSLFSAMHRGPCGIDRFNDRLQDLLNPGLSEADRDAAYVSSDDVSRMDAPGGWHEKLISHFVPDGDGKRAVYLRVGSRIVVTKNIKGDYGSDILVNNGDCGFLTGFLVFLTDSGTEFLCTLRLDGVPDLRTIRIRPDESCPLELGYAMSVHKAQGGEYDRVLIGIQSRLDAGSPFMKSFATRNLLYTAITRAKRSVFLCGRVSPCMSQMAINPSPPKKSGLNARMARVLRP